MTQYYVDIAVGNDGNAGTSPGAGNAWQTLNKAATTIAAGDVANIKASGTYTLTVAQLFTNGGSGTGEIVYKGYTTVPGADDGRPVITTATNSTNLLNLSSKLFIRFRHLYLSNTAGTKAEGIVVPTGNAQGITFEDCIFDGFRDAINGDFITNFTILNLCLSRCLIKNCSRHGIWNAMGGLIKNSTIRNNTNDGLKATANATAGTQLFRVISSIIAKNARGIHLETNQSAQGLQLIKSIIYGNTGDGIFRDDSDQLLTLGLEDSIIYGNGGWGVNNSAGAIFYGGNYYNAYGANTLGNLSNVEAGVGDITLTADPFIDAPNNDYNLNDIAGGGTLLRAANYDIAM